MHSPQPLRGSGGAGGGEVWPTSEAQKPLGERSKVSLKTNHTPYFRCDSRSHSSVTCPCTENARGVLIPGVSPLSALPPKPTLNPSLLTTQGSPAHPRRPFSGRRTLAAFLWSFCRCPPLTSPFVTATLGTGRWSVPLLHSGPSAVSLRKS